jgi:flagellar assembly protein FliH
LSRLLALPLDEFDEAPAPRRALAVPAAGFFARDLDATEAPPEPEPDPLPLLLAAARREGFEEGLAQGLDDARMGEEARIAMTLQAMQATLGDARVALQAQAAETAEAIAAAALAALTAALPSLADRLGEAETLRFAAGLLPLLAEEAELTLHVAPPLLDAIAARLAAHRRLEVLADPALAPGDARLAWRGGQAERQGVAAREAIAALLAEAGLA